MLNSLFKKYDQEIPLQPPKRLDCYLSNVLRDDFCLIWISLGRLSTSKIIFFYILYFWLFGSENLSRDLSILKRFSSKNNKWKISFFFLLREKKRKGKWMWMTDIGAKINVFLYFIRKNGFLWLCKSFKGSGWGFQRLRILKVIWWNRPFYFRRVFQISSVTSYLNRRKLKNCQCCTKHKLNRKLSWDRKTKIT